MSISLSVCNEGYLKLIWFSFTVKLIIGPGTHVATLLRHICIQKVRLSETWFSQLLFRIDCWNISWRFPLQMSICYIIFLVFKYLYLYATYFMTFNRLLYNWQSVQPWVLWIYIWLLSSLFKNYTLIYRLPILIQK